MIIPVDESNVLQAAAIHSIAWRDSHQAFCTPEFTESHNAGARVYMLVDEKPAGIVSITGSLIEDLYVLPELQNRGYGTELLHFAISMCAETPRLWILENNVNAARLYRRMGFMETGKRNPIADGLDELEFALAFSYRRYRQEK